MPNNEGLFHFNEDEEDVWCLVVFSPAQASQGLERRTDFNSGVLETSEKRECVCVERGRGGGGEGDRKECITPFVPAFFND